MADLIQYSYRTVKFCLNLMQCKFSIKSILLCLPVGLLLIIAFTYNNISKYQHKKSNSSSNRVFDGPFQFKEVTQFSDDDLDVKRYHTPLIPHIIHQYWDYYEPVPEVYLNYIKTVVKHHPDWEYWFWTNSDVDCYFKTQHPGFYNIYRRYESKISRADVMRYFILYDYGGIYLDLDMEVLKPLDIWTYISPCVLSYENYEHSFVYYKRESPNVINAAMATIPHHPFFEMLQNSLKAHQILRHSDILRSTGPFYMNKILQEYLLQNRVRPEEQITLLDPKYWFPTYDPAVNLSSACGIDCGETTHPALVSDKCKAARYFCDNHHKMRNQPKNESFLNHHWVHTYLQDAKFKTENTGSVFSVAPNLIRVNKKLHLHC